MAVLVTLSEFARDLKAGYQPKQTAISLTFAATGKTITRGSGSWIDDGFLPGDVIKVADTSSNDGYYTVASMTDLVLTVTEAVVNEGPIATDIEVVMLGRGLAGMFRYGLLVGWSGSAADPDSAESGTKLVEITLNGLAFTAGQTQGGLIWEANLSSFRMEKPSGSSWSGLGLSAGNLGHFVLYSNGYHTGVDSNAVRIVLSCGTTSGAVQVSSLAVAVDLPVTVSYAYVNVPA